MGKVIYWELCQKFKFDHTNKWYTHNPKSFYTQLLRDFYIQTTHLFLARRPDLIIISNKKNYKIVDFAVQLTTE